LLAKPDIRDRHVFALALALGALGLSAATAAAATAIASVHHSQIGVDQLQVGGSRFTYPTLNGSGAFLFVVGALGAAVIAVTIRASWRQARRYRTFVAEIGPAEALGRDPSVKVIADPRPQAFCAGYLRPAVYVSRRTVELLTEPELGAVLAHEHHHRRVRDPLRFAATRILSQALFFVPVLRPLCERYADLAELSADRAAVSASEWHKAHLASALLVFDDNAPPDVAGVSPERVDSLLGYPSGWRLPTRLLAGSVGILAALAVLVWALSGVASAHASFNLPLLSSKPCVVMTGVLPFAGCIRLAARRARRAVRRAGR
jgi:Zn-dependent protease with chaperone function